MASIDELMKGKKPGEIKITCPDMGEKSYFIPFFRDEHGFWNGLDELGCHRFFSLPRDWEIYTEPKPKKILYEFMYRTKKSFPDGKGAWHLSARLLEDEKFVCLSDGIYEYRKTGRTFEVEDA